MIRLTLQILTLIIMILFYLFLLAYALIGSTVPTAPTHKPNHAPKTRAVHYASTFDHSTTVVYYIGSNRYNL